MISKNKLRATKEDKSPRPEKGKLLTRLLSGVVIVAVTIGMIFAGKWAFTAFIALLAGISLYEWSRMVLTKDKNHIFITSSILAMAAIIIVAVVNTAVFAPLLGLGLAFLLRVHAGFRGIHEGLTRLAGGFFYIVLTL
ncbi:MAG: phosphatidate cytidylyltransferase, partial [Pseudomonadota bacterium]